MQTGCEERETCGRKDGITVAVRTKTHLAKKNITLAFLGDGLTCGCFEHYRAAPGCLGDVLEPQEGYVAKLENLLRLECPRKTVSVVSAGRSGGTAESVLPYLDNMVASRPDLAVVCLGINDVMLGPKRVSGFCDALGEIFAVLEAEEIPCVFMTPNTLSTYVSGEIRLEEVRERAELAVHCQNMGLYEAYLDKAKELARKSGVSVCDCYREWMKLHCAGVDVTALLCNHVNHPSRRMHGLFASKLLQWMAEERPALLC